MEFLKDVQLCTGGWGLYWGENNELTGEAMWGIAMPAQNPNAVHNLDTGETFPTIQNAINDADTLAGHTLEVTDDIDEGLVHIDKDVTIQGGSVHTVYATTDTGSAGDARGWFLVDAGVELDVQDLNFDGNGHLIYQGFRHKGWGTFTNCGFNDIKFNESGPTYSGVAIAAFSSAPDPGTVDCIACTFSDIGRVGVLYFGDNASGSVFADCQYTGKDGGNWLDYCLDISAGAQVTVSGCTITKCRGVASSDGSTSAAIMVTDLYGPGTGSTITDCTLSDNSTAIFVGYDLTDASAVVANYNDISGNDFGIDSVSSTLVDAEKQLLGVMPADRWIWTMTRSRQLSSATARAHPSTSPTLTVWVTACSTPRLRWLITVRGWRRGCICKSRPAIRLATVRELAKRSRLRLLQRTSSTRFWVVSSC